MHTSFFVDLVYIVASILFIFGLKFLGSPKTAPRGNYLSAIGMLMAVLVTLLNQQIITYQWILFGGIAGAVVGAYVSQRVAMTQLPEMVALLHGFGGLASLLVGWSEYHRYYTTTGVATFTLVAIALAVVIGGITFSGSMVAYGKLSEKIPGRPLTLPGQKYLNMVMLIAIVVLSWFYCSLPVSATSNNYALLMGLICLSLIIGVTTVIPIGGADMPVVISVLNSYSGLAACAAGFIILNNVLIVVGALVGASGFILSQIMCKAMNTSLIAILFSGFNAHKNTGITKNAGEIKAISVEDAYFILEAAKSVVIVPGYGMAVAQAQHVVRELAEFLEANGTEVKYAIHPVAGRMPGHMNVLLAEANVSYDKLVEPDDVNPNMEAVDVCIVIGANDVVNTSARDDQQSPIYGMPIIEVDRAKTIFILKRSMKAGFSGLDNPLFGHQKTRMLFGDGKETVSRLVAEFKTA
jgi:NAD(P) transhydrogenase subunit beta